MKYYILVPLLAKKRKQKGKKQTKKVGRNLYQCKTWVEEWWLGLILFVHHRDTLSWLTRPQFWGESGSYDIGETDALHKWKKKILFPKSPAFNTAEMLR